MDVLKCKTVDGVLKELAIFALVYNLVRSVAVRGGEASGGEADRVSFVDAVRWLRGAEGERRCRSWWSTRRVQAGSTPG